MPKYLVEAHAVRREDLERRAEANRPRRQDVQAFPPRFVEQQAAAVEGEEIDAVHDDVHALQELVDIFRLDAFAEEHDLGFRVDGQRHLAHDLHLLAAERVHRRPDLPIEVAQLEGVEVGEVKATDAHPRQRHEVQSADAADAGHRNPRVPDSLLLLFLDQAEVALKGLAVEVGGGIGCCGHLSRSRLLSPGRTIADSAAAVPHEVAVGRPPQLAPAREAAAIWLRSALTVSPG